MLYCPAQPKTMPGNVKKYAKQINTLDFAYLKVYNTICRLKERYDAG